MELVQIAKTLWSRRALLALGAAIGLLGALSVLYHPGLPPQSRTTSVGAASTEILIDAPQSTLGDLRRDITPLVARGGIFARFLATDEAARDIGREAGIPAQQITVAGPKLSIDGVPDQSSAKRAIKLGQSGRYLVQVQQGDDLPVLSIFTQAPTAEGARKLANGTAAALRAAVTDIQVQTGVPDKRRLTIRQLGTARGGDLEEKPSVLLALVAFCALFGAACLAILAWPRIVAAWRAPRPQQPAAWGGANGASHAPLDQESAAIDLAVVSADNGLLLEVPPSVDDSRSAKGRRRRTGPGSRSKAKRNEREAARAAEHRT